MRLRKIFYVILVVILMVATFSTSVSADLAQNTPDGATAMLYCVDENGNTLATYYYWGTSWTSFTETAPSITGYTPEKSSIKITHGLVFTKEYTLKYTRNSYKLTIYYKYANGSTAATTHTSTVKYGDYYSISSPSINGYSPSNYSVYGTMRASDKTATVTYTAKTYTVTVNYQYANGKTAATSQSKSGVNGTSYSFTSPTISGYTPSQSVVSGTIDGSETITVTYKANPVTPKYTLTINYVYSTGGTASTSYTSTMESGSSYSVSSPTISGYTADKTTVSGTLTSNTTVTVTYTKNQPTTYTLTIYYKYDTGGTAATTYKTTLEKGSSYSVTSPSISGYTADTSRVSGTLNANRTVTVYYSADEEEEPAITYYTLTIYYKYASGGTAASTYSRSYSSGSYYSVSSPSVSGYSPDKYTVSGTLTSNKSVTVYYTEDIVETPTYTLTIYYKYADGTTAASTYSKTMDQGSTYSVTSPTITNYTANKSVVSGTLTSNTSVTVTYSKNQYTLTIYYKYADGTTAATTYTKKMDVGSTYNVSSPSITNYTASKTTVSGTLNGNVTETVTYNKNQYTLTIYYKYADGTTASTTYIKKMDIGSSYNVSSPTITNYHADKTSVSGTLNADTTVTVYYSKDQYTLTIYYKYADGTTAATTYTGKMNVGSSYSVTSPTIEDYVADKTVVSGTLSGNKSVTVTYSARTPDVSFEADGGSGNYTAGTTVISSFTVKNGAYNIKPFMNCDIAFRTYYIENGTQKTVATDTWDNFVIPKNEEGLVYFMWDVPESLAGKTVYGEISYGSQTMSFSKTVKAKAVSQVPNTRYETEKPSGFTSKSAGSASRGSAEWEIWEYEGGSYEKVKYTLSISADVEIKPDSNSFSAVYENGKWTMRSGYGYTISVKMNVSATSGADYTKGQCASAYLPEYKYSKTKNEYCTLELVDDTFQFATNTASAESARIVFMPVWYPDGGYTVKVVITDVWTPAGVVSVTGISNTITVSGTVFDDFYVGA